MTRPANIWMITGDDEFSRFVVNGGGWVILVTENPSPFLANHPNSLGASVLLPPYESIAAEIDGNIQLSESIYLDHLGSPVCAQYINAILVAVIGAKPLGIYIGREEIEMGFVKVLLNYFFNVYGISIGSASRMVSSFIDDRFLPGILNQLYLANAIDFEVFMINYPVNCPLNMSVIPKMVAEINPVVPNRDIQNYYQYFTLRLNEIKKNNNIFLIDPIVGDPR